MELERTESGETRTDSTFPANAGGLASCLQCLSAEFASPQPKIIVDEIVSNIVRCSGATSFTLSIVRGPDGTKLVFSDDGKPFDPTNTAEPDITVPIQEREIGGLGLFMVRRMSKSLHYAYEDGHNVLTVALKG